MITAHLEDVPSGTRRTCLHELSGGPMDWSNFRRRDWAPALVAAPLTRDCESTICATPRRPYSSPKEHTPRSYRNTSAIVQLSITMDRYGHLYPEDRIQGHRRPRRGIHGSQEGDSVSRVFDRDADQMRTKPAATTAGIQRNPREVVSSQGFLWSRVSDSNR